MGERREVASCPACGASETEIKERGHKRLDGLGRPLEEPITGPSSACPEACSCIPEHFSLVEHAADVRHWDEHDRAKQAKGDVN
ncbi:MAG: hypothetical protein OXU20_06165 [Myxococcales bacterium]|nr:hypothetical protein [Myxococcales bacterium]